MRHKFILILLSILTFMGIFQLTQAATGVQLTSSTGSYSASGAISSMDTFIATSLEYGKAWYQDIYEWYNRYNKPTTILPEILRVSIIDLFGVIL